MRARSAAVSVAPSRCTKYAVVPSASPSREAPLSEVNTMIVLSSSPIWSNAVRRRPKLSSIEVTMAAYTSM